MASALLHSDAMPALSRLLSSEAQRGPARALLSPRQLATCLKLVSKLFYTAQKLPSALLDVTSCAEGTRWYGQQQQQHQQQRPSSTVGQNQRPAGSPAASPSRPPSVPQRSTAAFATCTTATPAASPAPSGLAGSGISPATRAAANTRASKGRSRTPRNTGSATVPSPQRQVPTSSTSSSAPPQPPLLATAVLTDVAESGVVEAACTVAVQLLSSRQQGEGTHWSRGDREHLVMGVMDLLYRLVQLVQYAGRQTEIPLGLLASTFTGSCVQYTLAAHSVSQLHAVDGGATYGMPHDTLMLPLLEKGGPALSCEGMVVATDWWVYVCLTGGMPRLQTLGPRGLAPHGLFELCLRQAEAAADCWRRRNGLPAAGAAAGAAGGAVSGGGSSGMGGRSGGGAGAAAQAGRTGGRPLLAPGRCPVLALAAVRCSQYVMERSSRTEVMCGGGGGGSGSGGGSGGVVAAACSSGGATSGPLAGQQGVSMGAGSWLGDGGPLAQRWWRAAVAAVHCGVEQATTEDLQSAVSASLRLLNLTPAVPGVNEVQEPGKGLPAAPPASLSAALDAGYLLCLERTLRCGLRCGASMGSLVGFPVDDTYTRDCTRWPLLLAYGGEREAAALLATAAKVARRMCGSSTATGAGAELQQSATAWLQDMVFQVLTAGEVLAKWDWPQGSANQPQAAAGRAAPSPGTGSSSGSSMAACSSNPSTPSSAEASRLSPPEQQLLRLLSYGVQLWLPLYLDLPAMSDCRDLDSRTVCNRIGGVLDLMACGMQSCQLASNRGSSRAADSWRQLLRRGQGLQAVLQRCREQLQAEVAVRQGGAAGDEVQHGEQLLRKIGQMEHLWCVIGVGAEQEEMEGLGEACPLLWLLDTPCDAGGILRCCSNPRCVEVAGDSEAGVVLKHCGGACGGVVAYCCAVCQRAHWAAGHREECGKTGGDKAGVAGTGK